MGQCTECGGDFDRKIGEPDLKWIRVCFSCYLQQNELARRISISEEDDEVQLRIQADSDLSMFRYSYTFESLEEAKDVGEMLAEKLQFVLIIEVIEEGNYVIIAVRNEDDASRIREQISNSSLSALTESIQIKPIHHPYESGEPTRYDGEPLLPRSVCWRMAMWRGSDYLDSLSMIGTRPPRREHLCFKDIPWVLNSSRGISDNAADQIRTSCINHFVEINGFEEVETLVDIRPTVSEAMPVAMHVFPRLRDWLEEYARENPEYLSPKSRRGIERNRAGKELESTFRELCVDYDLNCWSSDKLFSVRYQLQRLQQGKPDYFSQEDYERRLRQVESEFSQVPSGAKEIADKVDSSSGFPDFVVWGPSDDLDDFVEDLSENLERKSGVLLVEAKYRSDPDDTAYFTDDQKEQIPRLMELDADVYVFRATSDNYWLKRPEV